MKVGGSPGKPARAVFGWKPREIGWLSCALQFFGTLLFNANTFDALAALISVFFKLLGAFGFLAGSPLILPEASDAALPGSPSAA